MQIAIDASISFAQQEEVLHIGNIRKMDRVLINRKDKHSPLHVLNGQLVQFDVLNQFHAKYISISDEYNGPSAICGFFSCAYAILLERHLSAKTSMQITEEDLAGWKAANSICCS